MNGCNGQMETFEQINLSPLCNQYQTFEVLHVVVFSHKSQLGGAPFPLQKVWTLQGAISQLCTVIIGKEIRILKKNYKNLENRYIQCGRCSAPSFQK